MLQENSSPEEHLLYVWDHFVSNAAARNVFIVAHSYGGLSLVELVSGCFPPLVLSLPHRPSSQPPLGQRASVIECETWWNYYK